MEEGALAKVVSFGIIGTFLALLGLAALFFYTGSCCPIPAHVPAGTVITCSCASIPPPPDLIYGPLFIGAFAFLFAAFAVARNSREAY